MMIRVRMPEGTHLTGNAETIVRIMRDGHWTVGEQSIEAYMERVQQDALRFQGAKIRTDGPEEFLDSLAENKMITIEEVA